MIYKICVNELKISLKFKENFTFKPNNTNSLCNMSSIYTHIHAVIQYIWLCSSISAALTALRSQETLEPVDGMLGVSLVSVIVIDVI